MKQYDPLKWRWRHLSRPLVALLLFIAGWLLLKPQTAVQAQSGPTILQNEAILDFPETVTFRLDLATDSPIVDAELTYNIGQASCLDAGTQVPVEVSGPALEWVWVMTRSGNPPPGASLWWEWTVTDAAGNTLTTPRQELTFRDDRFEWRTLEANNIQMNWYEGDNVGPTLLDAAVAGLDQLENDMGIELQDTVQFFIYGDSAAMREAVLYTQDWAGGLAFVEYNTILIGVPPGLADSWGRRTVRHELAHLVIGQFGRSCLGGSRPTWLNEGLAVYAEGEPDSSTRRDLENGIANNSFDPVRSLNGAFPAHSGEATLAYSQSYSLAAFLLAQYGRDKMQALLLVLAAGEGYDVALEQVYGFNADGLETAWRSWLGAPARQIPPTPTPILAANVPTIVPLGAPQSLPTPAPEGFVAPVETTAVAPTLAVEASPPAAGLPATVAPDAVAQGPPTAPPTAVPEAPDDSSINCSLALLPLFLIGLAAVGRPSGLRPAGKER